MMQTLVDTSVRRFVFGLADGDGEIDAETLYMAAEAVGFTTTKLRLGLRRLADGGLLSIDGRGRRAHITLSPAALESRIPDMVWTGAAHRMDAGLDPWDGHWHLVAFEIPEARRIARDALRTRITELFGGSLGSALYVSPLPWEPWLLAVAEQHDIRDRLTLIDTDVLVHGGLRDPRAIAAAVWPLDQIDADYRSFVDTWGDVWLSVPQDPREAIRAAFLAAEQFETAFRADPLLPPEILPETFAGPTARRLFIDLLTALSDHAVVARADLFSTYRATVEHALTASASAFWSQAFSQTA